MSDKHTPPWRFGKPNVISDYEGRVVSEICVECFPNKEDYEEIGNLIAAAPELLHYLSWLAPAFRNLLTQTVNMGATGTSNPFYKNIINDLHKADIAIRKAKGES